MTDDPLDEKLAAELDRRAASANLSRDWSRRVLLPAVMSGIDSRTQPVMTSRWSAFAGLIAVVAILLVLVVAVPRLTPGPASTDFPNGSATVLSAAEFASRFVADELNGMTVLVDGRIRPYDGGGILYGTVCAQAPEFPADYAPNYDCSLGRLDGVPESVWVHAPWVATPALQPSTFAEPGGWSWRAPQPPIEGRLVLSVSAAGSIAYIGSVVPSNPSAISVAAANQVAVGSLTNQEVMLVEGWLWSAERTDGPVTISIDCISPASTPIPGLPNYYCQPHDAVVDYRNNTGNSATAPEPRLRVQRGAALRHGGTVGRAPHIFALAPRLHGGDCEAEPPCWKWEVVARLGDVPALETSATPVATFVPAEPTLTPRPTPFATPQTAPEPIACSEEEVHATVYDETSLVVACETVSPTDDGDGTILSNPRGDLRVLRITWGTSPCDKDASFRLMSTAGGFVLEERPGTYPHLDDETPICRAKRERHAIQLQLAGDIDVRELTYRFAPTDPAPTPELGTAWWELAPTERPTATTTQLDLLVFEEACSGGESPEGRVFGPVVKYSDLAVIITLQTRPLAGAHECSTAPGAEVTVFLSEPLGDRRLVDGGFASTDRVLEHGDGFLRVAPLRSLERATARLHALLGPDACPETATEPRAVDEEQLVQMANDLGTRNGMLGDGLAWVGDTESAVRGLGGFELYQDRDRAWYMIGFAEYQEWLADDVDPGDLVLADMTSLPISGGRTIWIPGRYQQTFGSADCQWESDETSATGPRADQQAFDFTVSISAPSASWTAGQSLDGFGAALEYSGAQDLDVGGSGSGIAFAYWSRIDGDSAEPPLEVTADCRSYQFASGEMRAVPMFYAPGFSHNGALTLPPGIWRLTAFTGFAIGDCSGQGVDITASIVVRVR